MGAPCRGRDPSGGAHPFWPKMGFWGVKFKIFSAKRVFILIKGCLVVCYLVCDQKIPSREKILRKFFSKKNFLPGARQNPSGGGKPLSCRGRRLSGGAPPQPPVIGGSQVSELAVALYKDIYFMRDME